MFTIEQIQEYKPRLAFIDTETTSLNTEKGAVIELALIIDEGGDVVDRNVWYAKPFERAEIVQEALDVNKRTFEEIHSFPDEKEMYSSFKERLSQDVNPYKRNKGLHDKFFFLAYNSKFDEDMLRSHFRRCGDNYFGSLFFNPSVDIMQMAIQKLMFHRHEMPDFKLATVASYLGIDFNEVDLHGAMFDIELARKVFYKLLSM